MTEGDHEEDDRVDEENNMIKIGRPDGASRERDRTRMPLPGEHLRCVAAAAGATKLLLLYNYYYYYYYYY